MPLILLIDDDRLVLATTAKGLRRAGYDVIDAASSEEALQVLEIRLPDLAIVDIRTPAVLDAAQLMYEKYGVPFLVFSSFFDEELLVNAVRNGTYGYLIKPMDITDMLPTIETALQKSKDKGKRSSDNP